MTVTAPPAGAGRPLRRALPHLGHGRPGRRGEQQRRRHLPRGHRLRRLQRRTLVNLTRATTLGGCSTPAALTMTCSLNSSAASLPGRARGHRGARDEPGDRAAVPARRRHQLGHARRDLRALQRGRRAAAGARTERHAHAGPDAAPTAEVAERRPRPRRRRRPPRRTRSRCAARAGQRPGSNGTSRWTRRPASRSARPWTPSTHRKLTTPSGAAEFSQGIFRLSRAGRFTVLTLTEPLTAASSAPGRPGPPPRRSSRASSGARARAPSAPRPLQRRDRAGHAVAGAGHLHQHAHAGHRGRVSVRDTVKRRSVVVRAGKRYTARPRR